jgi:hypothetical protein
MLGPHTNLSTNCPQRCWELNGYAAGCKQSTKHLRMVKLLSYILAYTTIVAITGTLIGCSPKEAPPADWLGRNADDFFKYFGPPKSQTRMPSGEHRYIWESRSAWRAITGQIPMLCQVVIHANSENEIVEFFPAIDFSVCAEKFGKRKQNIPG